MHDQPMWRWFVIGHLVAVVVGFGPLFVYPMLLRGMGGSPPEARAAILTSMARARRTVSEPAFLVVLPLGFTAALLHPDGQILRHGWMQVAIGFMVIAVAFVLVVQRPLSRQVAALAVTLAAGGSADGAERTSMSGRLDQRLRWLTRATWVSWAGLVVMLWLMIVKPGA